MRQLKCVKMSHQGEYSSLCSSGRRHYNVRLSSILSGMHYFQLCNTDGKVTLATALEAEVMAWAARIQVRVCPHFWVIGRSVLIASLAHQDMITLCV
jgi:hypothetical protein